MKALKPRIPGVFPHLVGEAAFIDVVDIAVWGERRVKILPYIAKEKSRAIGGQGRAYARCIPGTNTPTGNYVQFKHGKMLPYPNVSPFLVHLVANRQPVTCADAMFAMDGFLRLGCRAKISRIEVTFDTEGISLERFAWEVCSTARTFREFKSVHGTTLYIGGVNSPWQLKIYQKSYRIVRIEFKLTSVFLRSHDIVRPHEVALLKKSRLWDHVSFLKVDQSQGHKLPTKVKKHWTKLGHGLPPDMPTCLIRKTLRESHIDPSSWIVRSPHEEMLRKMLKNLVW